MEAHDQNSNQQPDEENEENNDGQIFNAVGGERLLPLIQFGPGGQLLPPLFNFRVNMFPFLENPNNSGPGLLHMLHDRLMEALYDNDDREEQAVEVSEATFETMSRLLQRKESIEILFKPEFCSDLFGKTFNKIAFFEKMNEFRNATWHIYKATFQYEDVIIGHAGCSASDQLIHFGMKWSVSERHFLIMFLDRFGTEDRPLPIRS